MKSLHTPTDKLEIAFSKGWKRFLKERPSFDLFAGPEVPVVLNCLDFDINSLTGGCQPYPYGRMTKRGHFAAETVVQWLGTPCGLAFLTDVFQKAGGRVIYDGYAALGDAP